MYLKEPLNIRGEAEECILFDELIILYRSTIEKLQDCSRYTPSEDLEENLENSNRETSQLLLQEKIIVAVLRRQVRQMSDVSKILKFWKMCVLGAKRESEYDHSEHLVLKSLDFIEGSEA